MKRDVRLPFVAVGSGGGEGGTRPDVSKGDPVKRVAGGPDGGKAVDEDRPEGGDVDVLRLRRTSSLALSIEEIYRRGGGHDE